MKVKEEEAKREEGGGGEEMNTGSRWDQACSHSVKTRSAAWF